MASRLGFRHVRSGLKIKFADCLLTAVVGCVELNSIRIGMINVVAISLRAAASYGVINRAAQNGLSTVLLVLHATTSRIRLGLIAERRRPGCWGESAPNLIGRVLTPSAWLGCWWRHAFPRGPLVVAEGVPSRIGGRSHQRR